MDDIKIVIFRDFIIKVEVLLGEHVSVFENPVFNLWCAKERGVILYSYLFIFLSFREIVE